MRTQFQIVAIGLALSIGVGACATAPAGGPADVTRQDERDAVVRVGNNNWLHVNVYAVRGSMRHRLGTVTSLSSETFRVPGHLLESGTTIRLVADPIGSDETWHTEPIHVSAGGYVDLTLENRIALSSYSAR